MTVRVSQLLKEIEALPISERDELASYLQDRAAINSAPCYLDRQAAQPLIQEILQTHAELFQKLAK
jgi:hypothetical protein